MTLDFLKTSSRFFIVFIAFLTTTYTTDPYHETLVSSTDVIQLCRLFKNEVNDSGGLMGHLLQRWSSHFVKLLQTHETTTIEISTANGIQNALVKLYFPLNQLQFDNILLNLSKEMMRDENMRAHGREQRTVHIICTGALASSVYDSSFTRARIPVSEEVYLMEVRELQNDNGQIFGGLWEIYGTGMPITCKLVYEFNFSTSDRSILDTTTLLNYGNRRQDLNGLLLKTVGQEDDSYRTALDIRLENGTTVLLKGGEFVHLLWDLQQMINFTFQLVYGTGWPNDLFENDTKLDGMAQQLLDMDADLTIIPMSFSVRRAKDLFFLPQLGFTESAVFYHPEFEYDPYLLLLPFKWELWLCIATTGILVVLTSACLMHIRNRDWVERHCGDNVTIPVSTVVTRVSATFLYQGGTFDPTIFALRAVFLTTAVTSSVLYITYSASFVASVSSFPVFRRSYKELVRSGYTIFTEPSSLHKCYNFVEDVEDMKTIQKNTELLYEGSVDMVEKVLDHRKKLAAIVTKDVFYGVAAANRLSPRRICRASSISARRESRVPEALAMRKGSPLLEIFTLKTTSLIERGLAHLYWHRYIRHTHPPCSTFVRPFNIIDLSECFCAFSVLVSGMVIAFAFIAVEYIFSELHS